MIRSPECLWDEEQNLLNQFYSQLSEEEMEREMSEEEVENHRNAIDQWIKENGSEELNLYNEFRKWYGDEGQLCDGKGNYILQNDSPRSFIQDWDVNEEGYCIYEGTDTLVLNTDGTPIKDPVLDQRVVRLYELENRINKK